MTTELDPKMQQALDEVLAYHDEHAYFPTVRELAGRLGTSVSTAHLRLCALQRAGVLVRTPGCPRALRLLGEARTGHAAEGLEAPVSS